MVSTVLGRLPPTLSARHRASPARNAGRRRFGLQILESRTLLAGNVEISLLNDELLIRGDDAANQLDISAMAGGGIVVSGLSDTLINGTAEPFATELAGDLIVRRRGGDDVLLAGGFAVSGEVRIHLGHGDDRILFQDATVQGETLIRTNDGQDRVAVLDNQFGGRMRLQLGAGDDEAVLEGSVFQGEFHVKGGDGSDTVTGDLADQNTIQGMLRTRGIDAALDLIADTEFGYQGDIAPAAWADLTPAWLRCGAGETQSPIDVANPNPDDLMNIVFNYQPGSDLRYFNNGRTVEVEYPEGSGITLDGEEYDLRQFHFHTPSEHAVAGQPFDMELHLVHGNAAGQLAVVGGLIRSGTANAAYDPFANNVPADEVVLPGPLNAADLLPADGRVDRYRGSLTTPPCSEGVIWSLFQGPVELSAAQIAAFQAVLGGNNRPVQSLHGCVVSGDTTE